MRVDCSLFVVDSTTVPGSDAPPPTPTLNMTQAQASRQLVGKGSVYTVATAIQLAAGLLALPLLTRMLPPAGYGRVALAIVIMQLLGMFLCAGLPAVVTREYFLIEEWRRDTASRTVVATATATAIGLGAIAFALGPIWGRWLHGFDHPLQLATFCAITFAITQSAQAILRARGEARRFVIVAVTPVLGGQSLGLILLAVFDRSPATYLLGVAAGNVAAVAIAMAWTRPSLRRTASRRELAGWFRMALPTIPHMLAMYAIAAADRVVVETLSGASAVGAYTIAYSIGALGVTLVNSANNAWAPLIYGAGEQRWRVLADTTRDVFRLGALVTSGIAMAAPLGLALVAPGDVYDLHTLVPVVAVVAFAAIPTIGYLSAAHVVFWHGRTTAFAWMTPTAAAVNIALVVLLLPRTGLLGVGIASIVAYSLLAALVQWRQRGLVAVPWYGRRWPVAFAATACVLGAIIPPGLPGDACRAVFAVGVAVQLVLELRSLMRGTSHRPLLLTKVSAPPISR